ncbi:MAG: hypothetical protein MHM6MM_005737 [Cercozoa sp. M6MM]
MADHTLLESLDDEIVTLVQHFDHQFQEAQCVAELISALYNAGHPDYSLQHTLIVPFCADFLSRLEEHKTILQKETRELSKLATHVRSRYAMLRHYTIRECVQMVDLCLKPDGDLTAKAKDALRQYQHRGLGDGTAANALALRHTPLFDLANLLAVYNIKCATDLALVARVRQQVRRSVSMSRQSVGGVRLLRVWLKALGHAFSKLPAPAQVQVRPLRAPLSRDDNLTASDGTSVFAAITPTPLRTILSVYVRRGVLPREGHVLMCDDSTTMEEIELLFWRCFGASREAIVLGDDAMDIFVLANVDCLAYNLQ